MALFKALPCQTHIRVCTVRVLFIEPCKYFEKCVEEEAHFCVNKEAISNTGLKESSQPPNLNKTWESFLVPCTCTMNCISICELQELDDE